MDIVLGVSMAPSAVQMVLMEGEAAGGVTVDEDRFAVAGDGAEATDRVVSAILGTLEGAHEGGYRLTSTGVTVGDQVQARALRAALTARKLDKVTLVSAFLAAAALAQAVGASLGYAQTALLFVEPESATLAVVDSADGSISEAHRSSLPADDAAAVTELAALTARVGALTAHPDGMFVVGSGVNVGLIKAELQAASPVPVSVPEEPETALARGAALASAHPPLFESSTSALAWARDPGTGVIDPDLIAHAYAQVSGRSTDYDATVGELALAYSAVDDDSDLPDLGEADHATPDSVSAADASARKPFLLAGSALGGLFVVGVTTLAIALAVSIRPTAGDHPAPSQHIVVPTAQAPAPAPKAQLPAPPAPPPTAVPTPAAPPVQQRAPVAQPAPPPEAPAPAAPPPAAPPPAPVAPAPIPIPIVVPAPVAPAPAAPPEFPQLPAPTWPPIFQPPKQSPPKQNPPKNGGLPGWPGNGGGKDGDNPWQPGNGGDRGGGLFPGFPGSGGDRGGGRNPWQPGNGGGHGDGGGGLFPGFPGNGGGGHGGGGFPWFGGGGHH